MNNYTHTNTHTHISLCKQQTNVHVSHILRSECSSGKPRFLPCNLSPPDHLDFVHAENSSARIISTGANARDLGSGISSTTAYLAINIVRKSQHYWIVSLMICFPLWSDKITIALRCWECDVISALSAGHSSAVHRVQTGGTLKQTCWSRNMF
jgi:hypothetical protein